jgi:hypothetical protein
MSEESARTRVLPALHLLVLWAFAVAQPLFGLLSDEPSFFVIRGSKPEDLFFVAGFLAIIAPLPLVLLLVAAGTLGRRVRLVTQGTLVACLLFALFLSPVHRLTPVSGLASIVAAAVLGISGSLLYLTRSWVRRYVTFLSPVLLLFPAYFLLKPGMRKVTVPRAVAFEHQGVVGRTPPIVFVIFDELPLVSLLDEHGLIDASRYPNLAALSDDATWYRNATTIADLTKNSVPSILTGRYPESSLIPSIQDHPHNLFRLLAGSYDFRVFESGSRLCPESLCRGSRAPFPTRVRSLLSDLRFVYLHILLPQELTTGLPPVTQNWQDFADQPRPTRAEKKAARRNAWAKDRSAEFASFLQEIKPSGRPTIYFLHSLLPHTPLAYLPSGKIYPAGGGVPARRSKFWWSNNEWTINQRYQRHLLQVGFVDSLLGRLWARLRETGLYDSSLIIVTADHGISFIPEGSRRRLTDQNCQDILSVPLLIKAPQQEQGAIDDRVFLSVDILPTIADYLDANVPWQVDGRSVLDPTTPVTRPIVAFSTLGKGWRRMVIQPATLDRKYESAQRKVSVFGSGNGWSGVFRLGPYGDLVGRHFDEIGVEGKAGLKVMLSLTAADFTVRSDEDFLPARLTGRARSRALQEEPFFLALAVNGLIRAVTRVDGQGLRKGTSIWELMLSETSFRPGENSIRFFVIDEVNGVSRLRSVKKVFAAS